MVRGPEKRRAVTVEVPEHLFAAFNENVTEFLTNARGGQTSAQRAAEVRAGDADAGLDALVLLEALTSSDTGQAGVIARFLAGLYNGADFPFDLTTLRQLDADLFEACLAVLRLDNQPKVEIHQYFVDGEVRFQRMLRDWGMIPPALPRS